jgi:hypothetical protein
LCKKKYEIFCGFNDEMGDEEDKKEGDGYMMAMPSKPSRAGTKGRKRR